jgi:hypothetical protein
MLGSLEQALNPFFDPDFDKTRGRHVPVFIAPRMPTSGVFSSREDVGGGYVIGVIVQYTLQPGDVTDRANSRAAEFADPFGNVVGGSKNLRCRLVQHQMTSRKWGRTRASENFWFLRTVRIVMSCLLGIAMSVGTTPHL